MFSGPWQLSTENLILFVLVDANGDEVSGIGTAFTLEISKAGAAFAEGNGTKAEISDGWYSYLTDPSDADTIGPVGIIINHASIIQQNLEYYVETRAINTQEFTYTVINTSTSNPIQGVYVIIATDSAGSNIIWTGFTDSFGVARDINGNLPRLQNGTYYLFRQKPGYSFSDPDIEVIS